MVATDVTACTGNPLLCLTLSDSGRGLMLSFCPFFLTPSPCVSAQCLTYRITAKTMKEVTEKRGEGQ